MGMVQFTMPSGVVTDIPTRSVKRIEAPPPHVVEEGTIYTKLHLIDGEVIIVDQSPSEVRKLLNAAGIR